MREGACDQWCTRKWTGSKPERASPPTGPLPQAPVLQPTSMLAAQRNESNTLQAEGRHTLLLLILGDRPVEVLTLLAQLLNTCHDDEGRRWGRSPGRMPTVRRVARRAGFASDPAGSIALRERKGRGGAQDK
eukprot:scaffold46768_cov37-Tisochrysis_lutea.AAC.1